MDLVIFYFFFVAVAVSIFLTINLWEKCHSFFHLRTFGVGFEFSIEVYKRLPGIDLYISEHPDPLSFGLMETMHRVGNGFEPLGSVLFATRLGRDSTKDSYTTIAETAFLQRNIAELQLESQIVESCHVALIGGDTGIAVNQLAQKLQLLPNQKNNLISVSEFQTGYETLLENYA